MLDRYWLSAIALIGLVTLLVFGWLLYEWRSENKRDYQAAYQQYEDTKRFHPPGVILDEKRSKYDPQAYREEWRSEYDLAAQRDMADWAYWMAIAGLASVFISFIAVVLVALAWRETRQTAIDTKRQADIAEKSFFTTNRPWLTFEGIIDFTISTYRGTPDDDIRFTPSIIIKLRVKNSGRTPANNVLFFTEILSPRPLYGEQDKRNFANRKINSVIGEGITIESATEIESAVLRCQVPEDVYYREIPVRGFRIQYCAIYRSMIIDEWLYSVQSTQIFTKHYDRFWGEDEREIKMDELRIEINPSNVFH